METDQSTLVSIHWTATIVSYHETSVLAGHVAVAQNFMQQNAPAALQRRAPGAFGLNTVATLLTCGKASQASP